MSYDDDEIERWMARHVDWQPHAVASHGGSVGLFQQLPAIWDTARDTRTARYWLTAAAVLAAAAGYVAAVGWAMYDERRRDEAQQ